jgi:hypothetical protein
MAQHQAAPGAGSAPISTAGSAHIAVLVKDNHVSRQAVKMAKALANPNYDTLTLLHVVTSEFARSDGSCVVGCCLYPRLLHACMQ